jgi:ribosomal protein L37E
MSITLFCHKCGAKSEFENKKNMCCPCGYKVENHNKVSDHVNMRKTWSGTTKVEFSSTTMEEDIARRNNDG